MRGTQGPAGLETVGKTWAGAGSYPLALGHKLWLGGGDGKLNRLGLEDWSSWVLGEGKLDGRGLGTNSMGGRGLGTGSMALASVAGLFTLHVHHPPRSELAQLSHQIGTSRWAGLSCMGLSLWLQTRHHLWASILGARLPQVPFATPILWRLSDTHMQEQFHLPPQEQPLK